MEPTPASPAFALLPNCLELPIIMSELSYQMGSMGVSPVRTLIDVDPTIQIAEGATVPSQMEDQTSAGAPPLQRWGHDDRTHKTAPSTAPHLKSITSSAGVYLLTDEHNRPILLAHAQNLRRAVEHRLTAPDPSEKTKRADLSAITRNVHWVETFSPFETTWIHYQLAKQLYPKTYRELIGFAPAWFIRIDPSAPFPRFTAVDRLKNDSAIYIGPLAASRDAEAWIAMLEDAFDLCRYFNVLEKAPHGERCAYFDMGKCPAPCDGTISMAEYHGMIQAALEFTLDQSNTRLSQLRDQMQRAAAALEFEKAATIRRTIERIESTIARPEYAQMTEISRLSWLIIQSASRPHRAASKQQIKPFFVHAGFIRSGEAASLQSPPLQEWIETLNSCITEPGTHHQIDPTTQSEVISLISRFLFQGEKAAGIHVRAEAMPKREHFAEMIQKKLGAGTGKILD